jgi:hypothetical protein
VGADGTCSHSGTYIKREDNVPSAHFPQTSLPWWQENIEADAEVSTAWPWSSYRTYTFNERNPVNMDWHFPPFTMRRVPPQHFGQL